jgi:hypothetical protein
MPRYPICPRYALDALGISYALACPICTCIIYTYIYSAMYMSHMYRIYDVHAMCPYTLYTMSLQHKRYMTHHHSLSIYPVLARSDYLSNTLGHTLGNIRDMTRYQRDKERYKSVKRNGEFVDSSIDTTLY